MNLPLCFVSYKFLLVKSKVKVRLENQGGLINPMDEVLTAKIIYSQDDVIPCVHHYDSLGNTKKYFHVKQNHH
jgi:hypothetical protein